MLDLIIIVIGILNVLIFADTSGYANTEAQPTTELCYGLQFDSGK